MTTDTREIRLSRSMKIGGASAIGILSLFAGWIKSDMKTMSDGFGARMDRTNATLDKIVEAQIEHQLLEQTVVGIQMEMLKDDVREDEDTDKIIALQLENALMKQKNVALSQRVAVLEKNGT